MEILLYAPGKTRSSPGWGRGDVADPVGGGGPVIVGAAAVPGGHGRREAGFEAIEA